MNKQELIKEVLERCVDKIYPSKEALEDVLKSGRKMKVYLGVDPTGPHLHLGHATNLLILKKLQNLGHKIIFLIGDFTARIGDPSGKTTARKPLTEEEVKANLKTFKIQAGNIIKFGGPNGAIVKFNSEWHTKMSLENMIKLTQLLTVQQIIKRDMFQKRLKENKDIWLHEFLYPILQGYDSVVMNVDMEIGGTDQTFNMLVGRDLMKKIKQKEKFVLTTKLLENKKTGKKLMNKSEGGLINLDDKPDDLFGKTMALPDEAILPVAELSTEMPWSEVKQLKKMKPRDAKLKVAFWVVKLCHSEQTAARARENWEKLFSKKEVPAKIPTLKLQDKKILPTELLVKSGLPSKSEARRLITQGAVELNGRKITNQQEKLNLSSGDVLKIGKHRFFKIQ
ncbi:MAG TPA: tyrosine--tRNA ligase [Candidatus Paceibacterota bacterium]|nr:tyrosine--tRNA ligase [Candidatus Paceibacterota bacterium]